jgi:hypothetical protein
VAREARKLRRAAERQTDEGKASKKSVFDQPVKPKPVEVPDPLRGEAFKKMLLRLALPLAAVWIVGGFIANFTYSSIGKSFAIGVPAVVTVALVAVVAFAVRQAQRARGVASILSTVESAEDRRAAIEKIETSYKKKDPAAVFAKAQLELQEDPKKALETLKQIDLAKVQAPIADEARAQRAMIHLLLGEVAEARPLADGIQLSRHQEPKSRAMLAAVIGESLSRSGQAKKGLETLQALDPEDAEYADLRPQLYRAYAYAYAHTGDSGGMKKMLKKLMAVDLRLLAGFMAKKTHPLLQKEAKKLLAQSGQMPRKMVVQRH